MLPFGRTLTFPGRDAPPGCPTTALLSSMKPVMTMLPPSPLLRNERRGEAGAIPRLHLDLCQTQIMDDSDSLPKIATNPAPERGISQRVHKGHKVLILGGSS
jgi:hypothetical protein